MSQEKPQGQEAEVQTESQNDMEDAKPLISKTQSLDTPPVESLDDKEKSGFSIRRSRTLPGRLKASHLELEDRTGICNSLSYSSGVIHVGMMPHISESWSGLLARRARCSLRCPVGGHFL